MEVNKKTRVVMLPAEDSSILYKDGLTGGLVYGTESPEHRHELSIKQHLYFLSDEEIKEGDWVSHKNCELISKVVAVNTYTTDSVNTEHGDGYQDEFSKVIATTDESLGLPKPSQEFLKAYVGAGGIEWVNVEYQANEFVKDGISRPVVDDGVLKDYKGHWIYKPKVNSHNEITIHPIKDSWSREETKEIAWKAIIQYKIANKDMKAPFTELPKWFDNWIKENL